MTTGSWTPASKAQPLDAALLEQALCHTEADNFPEQTPDQLAALQIFARSEQTQWTDVLPGISSEHLRLLCRFFTLAEAHWSSWQGGDKNPVIWFCKELKKRGEFPDKDLTLWIKAHTENRFLPYGNPLG